MGTGYRAENTDFVPQMKTSSKVHICWHWFFTLLIMTCYAKQCWFATNYL